MVYLSLAVASITYILLAYIAYLITPALHSGITAKQVRLILVILAYFCVCYISIIADMFLLTRSMYLYLILKNGLLVLFATVSFIPIFLGRRLFCCANRRK